MKSLSVYHQIVEHQRPNESLLAGCMQINHKSETLNNLGISSCFSAGCRSNNSGGPHHHQHQRRNHHQWRDVAVGPNPGVPPAASPTVASIARWWLSRDDQLPHNSLVFRMNAPTCASEWIRLSFSLARLYLLPFCLIQRRRQEKKLNFAWEEFSQLVCNKLGPLSFTFKAIMVTL